MGKYTLECCVDSVESALAAEAGGADRLELCAGLIIGGTSPGLALFEQVREVCGLPVRVLSMEGGLVQVSLGLIAHETHIAPQQDVLGQGRF